LQILKENINESKLGEEYTKLISELKSKNTQLNNELQELKIKYDNLQKNQKKSIYIPEYNKTSNKKDI
jgi:hypothetical protein